MSENIVTPVETDVQCLHNHLTLDSGFRRNDRKRYFQTRRPLSILKFDIPLTFGFCHSKFSIASAIQRSFAWIHNVVRVQGPLDLPHQCHLYGIMFQRHIVCLGEADAVFTR